MLQSKETEEKMRNSSVIDICLSGKGYEVVSKALGLKRTAMRVIIYKWRKLGTVVIIPSNDWPTKITARAN